MYISSIDASRKTISVAIPLTGASGKTRIKQRTQLNSYGDSVATRQKPFHQSFYVEWQIGYDVPVNEKEKAQLTTLTDKTFVGANGKTKYLYELSEYIKYFFDWGIISTKELLEIKSYLQNLSDDACLDKHRDMAVKHSDFVGKNLNGIDFLVTIVEHPVIIHKFGRYEILTEIEIQKNQKAPGRQPMLYFCFPITELDGSEKILGRVAHSKEIATFTLNSNHKSVLLEVLKIFGTLSYKHKQDVIKIIDLVLEV